MGGGRLIGPPSLLFYIQATMLWCFASWFLNCSRSLRVLVCDRAWDSIHRPAWPQPALYTTISCGPTSQLFSKPLHTFGKSSATLLHLRMYCCISALNIRLTDGAIVLLCYLVQASMTANLVPAAAYPTIATVCRTLCRSSLCGTGSALTDRNPQFQGSTLFVQCHTTTTYREARQGLTCQLCSAHSPSHVLMVGFMRVCHASASVSGHVVCRRAVG